MKYGLKMVARFSQVCDSISFHEQKIKRKHSLFAWEQSIKAFFFMGICQLFSFEKKAVVLNTHYYSIKKTHPNF